MNLKEAFRYQKFLVSMLNEACSSIRYETHAMVTVQLHKRSLIKEDAQDETKTLERPEGFYPNDDVLEFIKLLVSEREKLTTAIGKAKNSIGFDVDAAIEANKFRQKAADCIQAMLQFKEKTYLERGTSYTFNANGDQVPYYYDIETTKKIDYDKEKARNEMRKMIFDADNTSVQIDAAMINTAVEYEPIFNVNDTFEDAMETFLTLPKN